jgi:hypothetical protein
MDFGTRLSIALSVAAIGLAIFLLFVPYEWPDVPIWIRRSCMGLGIMVLLVAAGLFVVLPPVELPAVDLSFVGRRETYFQIHDVSAATARSIKWMIVMWDVDNPSQLDPLPIPATDFDFLTPHSQNLPVNVFQTPPVKPLIKEGDRLFGSASVMCPDCARGFTYWVFITWGHGGWFSLVDGMTNGNTTWPSSQGNAGPLMNQLLKEIPIAKRIEIKELIPGS